MKIATRRDRAKVTVHSSHTALVVEYSSPTGIPERNNPNPVDYPTARTRMQDRSYQG